MKLNIISDYACPWCYLGWHRLRRALTLRPQLRPEVKWLPLQLNPDLPEAGLDRRTYMLRKFGDLTRGQAVYDSVMRVARDDGLPLALDRIERTPNTLLAHAVMQAADGHADTGRLAQALFRAYLVEGRDIGDPGVLRRLCEHLMLPPAVIERGLTDRQLLATVISLDEQLRQQGIHATPSFVFDGTYMLSGAHDGRVLLPILDVILSNRVRPAGQPTLETAPTLPFA